MVAVVGPSAIHPSALEDGQTVAGIQGIERFHVIPLGSCEDGEERCRHLLGFPVVGCSRCLRRLRTVRGLGS